MEQIAWGQVKNMESRRHLQAGQMTTWSLLPLKNVKFIVCWLKSLTFCGIWGVKHIVKNMMFEKNQNIVALNVYFYLTGIYASQPWLFCLEQKFSLWHRDGGGGQD